MKRRAFILSLVPAVAGLLSCKKQPTVWDSEGFKEKLELPPKISGYFVVTPDNNILEFVIDGQTVYQSLLPGYVKTGKILFKG